MAIPLIDIFAGPGGLGEGFCALTDEENEPVFKVALSIEMDYYAHQTLTLRSFYRQFKPQDVPDEYYSFIRGEVTARELCQKYPAEARKAKMEAWRAKLGEDNKSVNHKHVDFRIRKALGNSKNWVLLGGPPCQAYSVVGRSRRQEKILDEKTDERVGLYKQYLRILAVHNPAVFIMENVKGLLSARTKESPVFSKIIKDLSNPVSAYLSEFKSNGIELECPGYRIYSLVKEPRDCDSNGNPVFRHKDFIIQAEDFGIPQTRHRVILLGVRKDIDNKPGILKPTAHIPISSVINGLPELRSTLSRKKDSEKAWKNAIRKIRGKFSLNNIGKDVQHEMNEQLSKLDELSRNSGCEYIPERGNNVCYRPEWYWDNKIRGVLNHTSRGHMSSDLLRYFFASCFARVKNRSPKLEDFPEYLLPSHKNIGAGIGDKKFSDRFRVQLGDEPCKTITSHISKDGHYYIHPDPLQCRSLTVREAARIQTFPDNYYFCGPRTSQFIQVGNAVPPLLANKIAEILSRVFKHFSSEEKASYNNATKSIGYQWLH